MSNLVTFEHPLNETMRICLSLEQMFQQADYEINHICNIWQTRNAVNTIIKLIHMIERPDLKNKITKSLTNNHQTLSLLLHNEKVNQEILADTLNTIELIIEQIDNKNNSIYHLVANNALLKTILQYSSTPSGPTNFNIPKYLLWLKQDPKKSQEELYSWISNFSAYKDAISILLKLTRNSKELENYTAENGFFHLNLGTSPTTQLIRVSLDIEKGIWPEISVGRHRLAISFNEKHDDSSIDQRLEFMLSCCY